MIKNIGRNDPCPCGSGKKYKQCCQNKNDTNNIAAKNRLLESIPKLFSQAVKHQTNEELILAETLYKEILTIDAKHIDTLHNLGIILRKKGELEESYHLLSKLIRLAPTSQHYCTLSVTLNAQRKQEEAISCLEKAIELNPGDYIAYNNLGTFYWSLNRYQDAIPYYQKAISLNSQDDSSFGNLAICYTGIGKYKEAGNFARQAIKIAIPRYQPSHYNKLLFSLCFDEHNFNNQYLHTAKELNNLLTKLYPNPYRYTLSNTKQILNIGFVSGDLHNHPVGYFLESVLNYLFTQPLQLFAYQTINYEDDLTQRIKPLFKQWHQIGELNDTQAAQLIYDDQIDILIDLSGHTGGNRLPLFALKPAPIQISWLGYWASTGLSCIDYFISDPTSTPQSLQSQFSEKLYCLPHTRLCFTPPNNAPEVSVLPSLAKQHMTFGCFQSLSKINDEVIKVWCQILYALPSSQLIIKNKQLSEEKTRINFIQHLVRLNAPIERIILEPASSKSLYYAAHHHIDIMLDTFPYPGGTTTCDALWMGVPTLTLTGNTLLARQGMSMLHNVGLDDWIAIDTHDYIQKAIFFAQNTTLLANIRTHLRQQMQLSPLTNAPLFAQHLSEAFFAMWQEKCASQHHN